MVSDNCLFSLIHQIFVLDAYLENALDSRLQNSITRHFIDDTLLVLGLEPLDPLGIYPAVDERAPGWSFIQPITTSHIGAHYFERPGKAPHIRIDAYSCDQIDWQQLVQVCFRHFNARELLEAVRGYSRFVETKNGVMVVSLAGAMSTAEIGKTDWEPWAHCPLSRHLAVGAELHFAGGLEPCALTGIALKYRYVSRLTTQR